MNSSIEAATRRPLQVEAEAFETKETGEDFFV
jgi:hypothetical protein